MLNNQARTNTDGGMDDCPQCHNPIKSPHARLVQDSCGHKKCRLCLMKDEDGCRLCAAKHGIGNTIKKESGGKKLPVPPPNIRRRSRRKLLTASTDNCKSQPIHAVDVVKTHKHKKKRFKDFEGHNSYKSSPSENENKDDATETEILQSESKDTSGCSEGTKKEEFDSEGDMDVSESKECDELEAAEVKVERKRKPLVIASHITVVQGNPVMYTCTVCVKTFKRREHIRYHNFCATGDKPYKCELCGQSFASKPHYVCHQLSHTGDRPYVCETCNRGFRQKDKLTRHIRIHTGERPYVCQQCGKGFVASYGLKTHLRIHTGEKPYLCPHCGRGFTETVNMRKHILTHTGERNFMCEGCGKSFGDKWALIHHQRTTHSRERPYSCQICYQAFSNNKYLKRHYLIHSDIRPYSCSICATAFRRKDNFERHMKNTHPETRVPSLNLLNKPHNGQLESAPQQQQEQQTLSLPPPLPPPPPPPPPPPLQSPTFTNNTGDTLEKVSNNIYKQVAQPDPFSGCIKTISRVPSKSPPKEVLDPMLHTGITKLLDPVRTSSITSFRDMLDPVYSMSSVPLFQQIPEARQKSQAVPVINRPITPAVHYPKIREKITIEATNCVPTITKTSNVLSNTNLAPQNVLTIVNTGNLCKKTEDSSQLTPRTLQSDLHWRKMLQHQHTFM